MYLNKLILIIIIISIFFLKSLPAAQVRHGAFSMGNWNPGDTYKLWVNGITYSVSGYESSDIRLKRNITPISNSLDKVKQLQDITYDWDADKHPERKFSDSRQIGLIAQDIEKVFPEAVLEDKDGFKAVNHDGLIGVLVEAIKEQQELITNLDKRIQELENN